MDTRIWYKFRDKKEAENLVADHLSIITHDKEVVIYSSDLFPDVCLYALHGTMPWYNSIVNYLVTKELRN